MSGGGIIIISRPIQNTSRRSSTFWTPFILYLNLNREMIILYTLKYKTSNIPLKIIRTTNHKRKHKYFSRNISLKKIRK